MLAPVIFDSSRGRTGSLAFMIKRMGISLRPRQTFSRRRPSWARPSLTSLVTHRSPEKVRSASKKLDDAVQANLAAKAQVEQTAAAIESAQAAVEDWAKRGPLLIDARWPPQSGGETHDRRIEMPGSASAEP